MKPLYRGILVAALHCAIVLSLAGKYAMDRERLPRVWVKTVPVDPDMPVRGRYTSLRLEVDAPADMPGAQYGWAHLSVQNERLIATAGPANTGVRMWRTANGRWALAEPVAFFLSEHVADPSPRVTGEELWVEVSVPKNGPPRPLRLGVKKDGVLTPLDLR